MSERAVSQAEALVRFTTGAYQLRRAIDGLSEAALGLSEAPGEWTIRQIVHHLADDGDAWALPMKKAIAAPGAPVRFESSPGNEFCVSAMAFDARSLGSAVALTEAHRLSLAELAGTIPGAWERHVMVLDAEGRQVQTLTCEEMIGTLADHLCRHVQTINAIRRQHGVYCRAEVGRCLVMPWRKRVALFPEERYHHSRRSAPSRAGESGW